MAAGNTPVSPSASVGVGRWGGDRRVGWFCSPRFMIFPDSTMTLEQIWHQHGPTTVQGPRGFPLFTLLSFDGVWFEVQYVYEGEKGRVCVSHLNDYTPIS